MADETLDRTADPVEDERELDGRRHFIAFDLAQDCAVGYHQARAVLAMCEWDVDRARRQLQADNAALDVTLEAFNVQVRYHPLIVDLALARGTAYYDLLRRILADIGPAMVADCERFKAETGTVTPVNLGQLMLRYGLSFKAICEYLEEARCLPTGTYEKLKRDGPKVREVLDAARKLEATHA